MKVSWILLALTACIIAISPAASAQQPPPCAEGTWSNPINFSYNGQLGYIEAPLLLTDGRVMAQYTGAPSNGLPGNPYQDWYALIPNNGNYATGTWAPLMSMYSLWSNMYGPYAFASAVLANGHVIVQGGEVNVPQGPGDAETNMGAIYDPFHDMWTQLKWPGYGTISQWPNIGDAQSVVLSDGTYMVAGCGSKYPCSQAFEQAQLTNEGSQAWAVINNNKHDRNSEEGYVLLTNGKVLTVDANSGSNTYETFDPGTQSWSYGNMPVKLWGNYPGANDIGPMILLPSGNVFASGTLSMEATTTPASTAVYYQATQSWAAGPTFPVQPYNPPTCTIMAGCPVGAGDEPEVLLPDGNVFLVAANNVAYKTFFEYQPNVGIRGALCSINGAPSALTNTQGLPLRLLLLPSGQVMLVGNSPFQPGTTAYYIYTPPAPQINSSWRPNNISVAGTLTRGSTSNPLQGVLLNGLSQANMLGDDFQNATNYPLVQITDSQGTILFAPTHDHSSMGVGNQGTVSTEFDVPCGLHTGSASLVVIANGIPSNPANSVTINDTGLCL